MAVSIGQLTTSDAVRSAVGLEEKDLPDEFFIAHDFGLELGLDLLKWFPTWADHIRADPAEPNVEHALFAYAKYWVAWTMAISHTTYTLSGLSDGQNEIRRQADHRSRELIASLRRKWSNYRALLISLLPGEALDTSPTRTFLSGASPSFDPVTNETT